MEKLIKANYDSIVKRGLITSLTKKSDFIKKIKEEVIELQNAKGKENNSEEMADVILTVLNFAHHWDIDIESEMKKKIRVNYERARNGN